MRSRDNISPLDVDKLMFLLHRLGIGRTVPKSLSIYIEYVKRTRKRISGQVDV
jgi:hypothetical protein